MWLPRGNDFLHTFAATLSIGLCCRVGADLPIHCTLGDAVGEWTFHIGPRQNVKGQLPSCGHSIPNSVASMLAINHTAIVPPEKATQLSITLTDEIILQPERHLKAVDGAGGEGMWTMVYDTGLEVRVGGRSLTAHFFFDDMANSVPQNGDNWEMIGKYFGRKRGEGSLDAGGATYACHCDVTSTGWWSRRAEDGGLEAGCLWAVKTGLLKPDVSLVDWLPARSAVSSLVRLRQAPRGSRLFAAATGASTATTSRLAPNASALPAGSTGNFLLTGTDLGADLGLDVDGTGQTLIKEVVRLNNGASSEDQRLAQWDKANPSKPSKSPKRNISLRGVMAHVARHDAQNAEAPANIIAGSLEGRKLDKLPRSFDWRSELAGMVPPGQDPLGEQSDQGPCGSCYAFAGIMVLQMRFRVQLYRQHGVLYPVELSYKSPTRCSPYTEGCNGGFSYFIFRLAAEVGVPDVACDKDVAAGALQQTCDWSCYKDSSQLFYASDYWHVGGFSHGSNEERIMREIYENGPVELAFSTTAVPEFVKLSGQSAKSETDVMTIILNDRAPKENYSSNPSINRWWFATHAILAVGWGEDRISWGLVKYWTVRNSWGRSWGEGGYAKLRRGNNDGGAETDASMVVPDMTRLPVGFLEKAKQHHADQAANRKIWKAKFEDGQTSVGGERLRGLPEYCKTRPNSPDCN